MVYNIFVVLLFLISSFIFYKLYAEDHEDIFEFLGSAALVIGGIALIVSLVLTPVFINECIKIKLAPKLYLIDYVTDKIKNSR